VGFPFARILSGASNRKKIFMLGFVLFPLITPILIRTFGWMILLQNKGVINTMLLKIGIVNNPINMMFNFFGNMVGLVQVFLPYTILILYDAFRKIDESQILAARTLGAKPFRIFWKIELPQLYSGIFASNAIVFILSAGAFITPAILGGRKETMVSQVIQDRIIYGSFPFAASLSVVFLVTIILFVYVFEKTIGIRNVFKEK
jgi:ABC-type spermidine/putrescine transport system permease subunit I